MVIPDGFKKLMIFLLPEAVLHVLKKVYYARIVQSISESSEVHFPIIKHLVSPGDLVVDIGANIGIYAKYLSGLVGQTGKVYSVEPVPQTYEILRYCIKRLRIKNVESVQCAMSDHEGTALIEIPHYSSGLENYYRAKVLECGIRTSLRLVEVPCRTIDSLFAEQSRSISFIKIDVEGHELSVARGGIATFRRFQPALLIEVNGDHDDPNGAANQLFELLSGAGYRPFCTDGSTVRLRRCGDHPIDYLFLASKHLQWLRRKGVPCDSTLTGSVHKH